MAGVAGCGLRLTPPPSPPPHLPHLPTPISYLFTAFVVVVIFALCSGVGEWEAGDLCTFLCILLFLLFLQYIFVVF